MKIAAIYCRVSSDKQKREATIDSQIAEIEERVRQDGNIIGEGLKFVDNGWSGGLLARPALDSMRDAASRKEFEVLYVYDRGRLARKFSYQELIIEELDELNIEFITLHDSKAETPEEKILQGMQGLFHEYERVKIAERMRRGKLYKAKQGFVVTSSPSYGYKYILKTRDKQGYYEIDEEEAAVVKKIFDWVANDGLTIRGVIKRLYELKILPRQRKRESWSKSQIIRVLKREDYIGTAYYNRRQGIIPKNHLKITKYRKTKKTSHIKRPKKEWIAIPVPAIIDRQLFYKAQKQLGVNYRQAKRNRKYDYILTGFIYCSCGSPMCGDKVAHHHYYRCSSRIKG